MSDEQADKTEEILKVNEEQTPADEPETQTVQSPPETTSDPTVPETSAEPPADAPDANGAVPPEPPQAPGLTAAEAKAIVEAESAKVVAALGALKAAFDGKLRYDAKKDAIIDRQHDELTGYRNGLVDRVTLQVVGDLIGEIDSAEKLVKYYEAAEPNEANYRKMLKALKDFPLSLCDVLEKHGVFPYRSAAGTPFDPKRQQVMKSTETGDRSLDKTIRESLRSGFEREIESPSGDGMRMKGVRSEMVDVYLYKPALDTAAEAPKPVAEAAAETKENAGSEVPPQQPDAETAS